MSALSIRRVDLKHLCLKEKRIGEAAFSISALSIERGGLKHQSLKYQERRP
jgi:hypothetical protein